MAYGPRDTDSLELTNPETPEAPSFGLPTQVGNEIRFVCTLPSTGLQGNTLTMFYQLGDFDPFGSATAEDLLARPGLAHFDIDVSGNSPGDAINVVVPVLGTSGTEWYTGALTV